MTEPQTIKPRRGRPPKSDRAFTDTREALIRAGVVLVTENGFLSAGIDNIVRTIGVPKGSFYHYFKNKEAFGLAVLEAYQQYFAQKLDRHLLNTKLPPLARIDDFVRSAGQGMARFDYARGCLVGNLLQESPLLPDTFGDVLKTILFDWQMRISRCLQEAIDSGEITDSRPAHQLAITFWTGWEGAVMRAKLFHSAEPLDDFWAFFRRALQPNT
ncbi:MAG TPA: TetR family transcriptional regulator C-terminal domain-containing protein [Buttiauxella sp.]|jgi:TetR/AcrR family transcriptional repressor of nem operon